MKDELESMDLTMEILQTQGKDVRAIVAKFQTDMADMKAAFQGEALASRSCETESLA